MHKLLFGIAALSATVAAGAANTQRVKVDQTTNWDTFMRLYPKRALAAREQGLVGFNVTIDRAGQPISCEVTHSSGHKQLDSETCDLVLTNVIFQPPKDANGNILSSFRTEGVINWKLPAGPANLVSPVQVASRSAPEKKVCKRQQRTGSLAGFERVCMTEREWDRGRAETRETWREQQGTAGVTSGN